MDLWFFEKEAAEKGCKDIAGIDEAGRGPLAGPVVSAAVILPGSFDLGGVDDSKRLTPKKRVALFGEIYRSAVSVGVGVVGPDRIDEINILQASLLSMAMAVAFSADPDAPLEERLMRALEGAQAVGGVPREEEGQGSGGQGQDQALGEELADETRS